MIIELKSCPRCAGDLEIGRTKDDIRCVQCGYAGGPIQWWDDAPVSTATRWVRMSPDLRSVFHRFELSTRALLCGRTLTGDTLDPYVVGDPLCGVCERLHTARE